MWESTWVEFADCFGGLHHLLTASSCTVNLRIADVIYRVINPHLGVLSWEFESEKCMHQ